MYNQEVSPINIISTNWVLVHLNVLLLINNIKIQLHYDLQRVLGFNHILNILYIFKFHHFPNQLETQNNKTYLEMFSLRSVIGKLKHKQMYL